jgi:hypothetical protein
VRPTQIHAVQCGKQARYFHQSLRKHSNWPAWFQSKHDDAFLAYDTFVNSNYRQDYTHVF